MKKMCISIQIALKFVLKAPIANNPVLIYIMSWRRIGNKPSEPMLSQFTDAYTLGGDELTPVSCETLFFVLPNPAQQVIS